MTVLYKASAVKSNFDPSGKTRYIARPCKRKNVDVYYISEIISRRSTLSVIDIVGVVQSMAELIPELLLENKTVQLEPFGTFSPSFKSDVEDDPNNITLRSIKEARIQFRPDKRLKSKLKNVELKKGD